MNEPTKMNHRRGALVVLAVILLFGPVALVPIEPEWVMKLWVGIVGGGGILAMLVMIYFAAAEEPWLF